MQREEDTQYNIAAAHQSFHAGHNHGPLDDEDYDDEDEDDYDSQEEEEEFDEDEMVCFGIQTTLWHLLNFAGCHDRRATNARRAADVSNICRTHVRTTCDDSIS